MYWGTHRMYPDHSCWCEVWYKEERFRAYYSESRGWLRDGKPMAYYFWNNWFWREIKEQDNG